MSCKCSFCGTDITNENASRHCSSLNNEEEAMGTLISLLSDYGQQLSPPEVALRIGAVEYPLMGMGRYLRRAPKEVLCLTLPRRKKHGSGQMLFFASSYPAKNAQWLILAPDWIKQRLVFPKGRPSFLFENYGLLDSVRRPASHNTAKLSGAQLCKWISYVEALLHKCETSVVEFA